MVSRHFIRRKPVLAVLPLAALLGFAATQPAAAQYYNTVGRADPSVIVDNSVLDQLGPPANIGNAPPPDGLTKTPSARRPTSYGGATGVGGAYGTLDKPPTSRLVAVPSMPGRPVPKIGGGAPRSSATPPATPRVAPAAAAPPAAAPPAAAPVAAAPRPVPMPAPMPAPAPTNTTNTTPAPLAPPPAPPAPPVVATIPAPPPAPPPVVSAPPVVAPAPPPAPISQVATAPATAPSSAGRLMFEGGSAVLSASAREELDSLATRLNGNEQRLKVVAYAAGQANNASQARRLSLSRALAVRSYLIDKGIRSTRIDVQAMGAPENATGAVDRVDLSLASQ